MLFDTHAHLLDEKFAADRFEIIEELPSNGIRGYVECATDIDSSVRAAALAKEYYAAYAAVGVHPHDASTWDGHAPHALRTLLHEKKVVAIGEIGLDYHYDFSPREKQKDVFREQMRLADETGYPVVIHSREATSDTLAVLREFPNVTGIMHCFSGSVETMHDVLDLGYYIAFGGSITFKNAVRPTETVRECPEDRILFETDSPYMTPVPYRGRRNTPLYVRNVVEKAAELRNTSADALGETATQNAAQILRIPDIMS